MAILSDFCNKRLTKNLSMVMDMMRLVAVAMEDGVEAAAAAEAEAEVDCMRPNEPKERAIASRDDAADAVVVHC